MKTYGPEYPYVCRNSPIGGIWPRLGSIHRPKSNFGMLHRLDRGTSGCVCVALNDTACHNLWMSRNAHTWDKEYFALVHGEIKPDHCYGAIREPLKKQLQGDKAQRKYNVMLCSECKYKEEQEAKGLAEAKESTGAFGSSFNRGCEANKRPGFECCNGSDCISYFQVLGYYRYNILKYPLHNNTRNLNIEYNNATMTLVSVKIESGRTHQIRTHMKLFCEGNPDKVDMTNTGTGLFGDGKYISVEGEFAEEWYSHPKL